MKKINKRIPGVLPPPSKTEIDGKVTNLSSKTINELLELKERQEKLLNKYFTGKLADNGAKVRAFLNKIVNELQVKQEEEHACQLLSKLNLNKESVEDIEWTGKNESNKDTYLDSDDDSEPEEVMQILCQNTAQAKKIKTIEPEKPLITPQDLINIGEQSYVKHIIDITEHNIKPKATGQFKPFKTTITNVHKPEKEILRKKHKHWEITAATPPPIVHGSAKVLSIEESLTLQKEYNRHLKEIVAQHAAEKLMSQANVKMAELPKDTTTFGSYRDIDSDDTKSEMSDAEGSDKEVHDEEPERGGVIVTVMK